MCRGSARTTATARGWYVRAHRVRACGHVLCGGAFGHERAPLAGAWGPLLTSRVNQVRGSVENKLTTRDRIAYQTPSVVNPTRSRV